MPLAIFGTLCLWGIVRSFFLENLTKEIIVSVAVLSILLSSLTRKYRGGFFLSAVIYGVLIRPYWILFSLSWVGVCVMKKYVSRFTFFLMLFMFYLAVAMAIQLRARVFRCRRFAPVTTNCARRARRARSR